MTKVRTTSNSLSPFIMGALVFLGLGVFTTSYFQLMDSFMAYGQTTPTPSSSPATPTTDVGETGTSLEQLKNQTTLLQKRINQIGNMTIELQGTLADLKDSDIQFRGDMESRLSGLSDRLDAIDGFLIGQDQTNNEQWRFNQCIIQAIEIGGSSGAQAMAETLGSCLQG